MLIAGVVGLTGEGALFDPVGNHAQLVRKIQVTIEIDFNHAAVTKGNVMASVFQKAGADNVTVQTSKMGAMEIGVGLMGMRVVQISI